MDWAAANEHECKSTKESRKRPCIGLSSFTVMPEIGSHPSSSAAAAGVRASASLDCAQKVEAGRGAEKWCVAHPDPIGIPARTSVIRE